ncbi:hypothetical protein HYR54_13870 [Candidatus Acetothermia bacterium]|nr:hypothetical protein [Candidatus Acetothermia bacterium]MBI3461336.1 hypothetical protein [Candidatus Acetothermia bacterium]
MFNDHSLWELAQAQQKETLKWAREERLAKETDGFLPKQSIEKPGVWQRCIWKLGDLTIAFGRWLKADQKPIL